MRLSLPFGKPRLGCFGKIASCAEYVNVPVGGEAEKAFRDRVDGMATVLQEAGAPCRTAYRFLQHAGTDDARAVLGWLWDSADRVGRRRPFAVYTVCPRGWFTAQGMGIALIAEALWDAVARAAWSGDKALVYRRAESEAEGEALRRRIEERLAKARCERPAVEDARARARARLSEHATASWLACLFPGGEEETRFAYVLWRMAALSVGDANGCSWPAIRLPWSGGGEAVTQAAFWLGFLEQRAAPPKILPPSLVIPEDRSAGGTALVVAFRPLEGGDARVLFGMADAHRDLADVRAPEGADALASAPFRDFAAEVKAWLAGRATAADLLDLPYADVHARLAAAID